MLADITLECPNTIAVLNSPYPIGRYTCLMHILEFAEKPEYEAIAKRELGAYLRRAPSRTGFWITVC